MFGFSKPKIDGETATFKIEGMHCTSCAMNIDGSLEETKGVLDVSTSYAKATTTVTFDPKLVNTEDLLKAIESAGYAAKEMIS